MKRYTATYIRHNPQTGDYDMRVTFEARSIASARKIAREKCTCSYGSKTLVNVMEADK